MSKRMVLAALALAGVFLATYLALYKLGIIGNLSCSIGHCETVNLSRWATLFGVPVAVWGVGFYLAVFLLALLGTMDRFLDATWVSHGLLGLTVWGVLFSGWLTYLELFVIHAICLWCVTSAILAIVLCGVSALEWRERPMDEGEV